MILQRKYRGHEHNAFIIIHIDVAFYEVKSYRELQHYIYVMIKISFKCKLQVEYFAGKFWPQHEYSILSQRIMCIGGKFPLWITHNINVNGKTIKC